MFHDWSTHFHAALPLPLPTHALWSVLRKCVTTVGKWVKLVKCSSNDISSSQRKALEYAEVIHNLLREKEEGKGF